MINPNPIDITNLPDLRKIAEEVEATNIPRELKRENKTVAVIMPVTPKGKTKTDSEAFRKAAGSLTGFIDAEKLKKDIYESRKLITRPAFKL